MEFSKKYGKLSEIISCSSCIAIEPHNFKILAFFLYGYRNPQLKHIATPAIVFSSYNFKLLSPLIGTFFG